MNGNLLYILSSLIPVGITLLFAIVVRFLHLYPYMFVPLAKTVLIVSVANTAYRIIYAMLTTEVDSWKRIKNRYSLQVALSTTVGFSTSLVASFYDKHKLFTLAENVFVATFGSWVVGNLIWLSDALLLGENLALSASDFIPKFHV